MSEPIVALFCGGRDWFDRAAIKADIDALPPQSVVIHGNCPGADRLSGELARRRKDLFVAGLESDWTLGPKNGHAANLAMFRMGVQKVYAYFTGGPTTKHCIELAEQQDIPVVLRERAEATVA